MIQLALIRHGHTSWNRQGRIQGRTDVPLDVDAENHLENLFLPDPWSTFDLVASPLQRAQQTAALIAGRPAKSVEALTEMDWGDWEGQKGAELIKYPTSGYRHIEDWGWDYRPPNGESPRDLLARLLPWVTSLSRNTVAVCHIGIMRVLLAKAYGWHFKGPAPFRIKRNRLYVLTVEGHDWHIIGDPVRLTERPT